MILGATLNYSAMVRCEFERGESPIPIEPGGAPMGWSPFKDFYKVGQTLDILSLLCQDPLYKFEPVEIGARSLHIARHQVFHAP